jgi:hypothetical protein
MRQHFLYVILSVQGRTYKHSFAPQKVRGPKRLQLSHSLDLPKGMKTLRSEILGFGGVGRGRGGAY